MNEKELQEFTTKIVKRTIVMMAVKWTLIIGVTHILNKAVKAAGEKD